MVRAGQLVQFEIDLIPLKYAELEARTTSVVIAGAEGIKCNRAEGY